MATLRAPISANQWFLLLLFLFTSQHLAIVGESIPATVLVFPLFILWLLRFKIARIDRVQGSLYVGMCSLALTSFILNRQNEQVSLPSVAYLIYLMAIFILRPSSPLLWRRVTARNFWDGYQKFMLLSAALGLMQLFLGSDYFSFRDLLPENLRVAGYNTTNAIEYGSDIFRSNGFFFYEPSFFSQFLGLAILVEMRTGRRPFALAIFLVSMLSSFSGTGILLLAVGLVLLGLETATIRGVVVTLLPILFIAFIGAYVFPEFFLSRLAEFNQENSSAYARFISPFIYIYEIYTSSLLGFLLGDGPGTSITVHFAEIIADFPGIGKVMYEYGILGTIFVAALYVKFAINTLSIRWLIVSLLIFQLMLSGGILQPSTLIFFVMFLLFGGYAFQQENVATRMCRDGNSTPRRARLSI